MDRGPICAWVEDDEMQMKKCLGMGLEVVVTRRWPSRSIAGISVDGQIQDGGSTESEALRALWRHPCAGHWSLARWRLDGRRTSFL
jgi:hypothetical protein